LFVKTPIALVEILFPSLIWRKKTNEKKIWLTFDDGPDEIVTDFLLSVLRKLKIKATFFLIGKQVKKYPLITKKILDTGHYIGNHSYSHIDGFLTSKKEYISDIDRASYLIDSKIFRPPYGKIRPIQLRHLKKKYKIIMWDILSWDFKKNISSDKLYKNVINNVENGSIIVFHNNMKSYKNLKQNLEKILLKLQKEGYSFSTTW
jgi:peptidoglycan/xylan/chitin deacetylase (PgdA/CDA1 family)